MLNRALIDNIIDWLALSGGKLASIIGALLLVYILYLLVSKTTKKALYIKSKTAKQKKNVILFISLIKYIFVVIGILVIIFILTGSLAGLGVSAGLLTAALGWALQRPITGIAAWIMILVKKPFQIGDRILIGETKGDVIDIGLTHIHLSELGGTIASEESSGRIILVPNSILFEQKIINYTLQSEFILDEAITRITFESNLEKAKDICLKAAKKFLSEELKELDEKPYVRIFQSDSGVLVKVRYKVRASDRIEVISKIHNEIINNVGKNKDVQIAYPHIHLIR